CIVKHGLTDADVLAAQIQANALRPETTVVEFARQLRRIMDDKAGMTMAELSSRIHKNPEWIGQQLSLLCLSPEAQRAVEQGKISMAAAYVLARVPSYFRQHYFAMAVTMPASDFVPLATAAMRQHRENVRHGRWSDQVHAVFTPVPYLRSLKEVRAECRDRQVGGLRLAKARCTDPVEAWYLALEWAAHMDAESVEEQRQRVLQQQRQATVDRCQRGDEEEEM
ncbi:MAG: ParB/RepB/Spo0J family partition protein, partial [Candidatus Cryosericum sp.]